MSENINEILEIKGYQIKEMIGRGGMGYVYSATESKSGEKVAIKLHKTEETSKDAKYQNRLLKEALIWNKLEHPNIVRFRDAGFSQNGQLYLVSDFIQGRNLSSLITTQSLDLGQILKLSIEMCDALAYIHTEGIIHSDIKPSNILLNDEKAFLFDFGLSIFSKASALIGLTPKYASPEQRAGKKITYKSDIYSLGRVIEEAISTVNGPQQRRTITSDLKISENNPRQKLSDLEKEVIEKLRPLTEKATQTVPGSRYDSATQMRDLILEIERTYYDSNVSEKKLSTRPPSKTEQEKRKKTDRSDPDLIDKTTEWTSRIHDHIAIFDTLSEEQFQLGIKYFTRLMRYLIDEPAFGDEAGGPESSEKYFYSLIHHIFEHDYKESNFIISGPPGTGKSSILGMLAVASRRILRKQGLSKQNVDYVNIHDLDEICKGEFSLNKDEIEKRIDETVSSIASKFNGKEGILFIDGLERHKRDRVPETQSLFISKCKDIKTIKIVGVGEYDGIEHAYDEIERNAEDIPFSNEEIVKLSAVPKDRFEPFCRSFIEFQDFISKFQQNSRSQKMNADALHKRLQVLKINRIDLLRINIVYVADEARSRSLTSAIESYCERQFEKQLSDGQNSKDNVRSALRLAAECVFQTYVSKNPDASNRYAIRCWGFVTGHPTIRNFFIAKHIIQVLYDIGEKIRIGSNKGKGKNEYKFVAEYLKSGLDSKLYPSEINAHCKFFLNSKMKDNVMVSLKELLESKDRSLTPTSTIHLCYLIGRVRDMDGETRKVLNNFIRNLDDRRKLCKINSAENCLLECTYTISLICLEPEDSHKHTKRFLDLLHDKEWAKNAISFHLMYYGDHDFDFSFLKTFRRLPDSLDYPRTLDTIANRIDAISGNGDSWYPLFDCDVAIISLLLISRQGVDHRSRGTSLLQCRDKARRLILNVRDSNNPRIKSRPVMPLMQFAYAFSQRSDQTEVFDVVTKFYECKYDSQRAGWLSKLGINGRVESVADHTWGAMILAEIILPEEPPSSLLGLSYAKAEVLRRLLIHDLAESYTGDRPADHPGQEFSGSQRKEELDFIELVSFLKIADSGHNTGIVFGLERFVERWKSVEERSDINGKIANFFDKCDAFIQFIVYSKYFFEQSRHDLRSRTWRGFFDSLKTELAGSVEGLDFLKETSIKIVSWGSRVFECDKTYLPHDEIFSDYMKYYPVRDTTGVHEKINFVTHSVVSRKRENTNQVVLSNQVGEKQP